MRKRLTWLNVIYCALFGVIAIHFLDAIMGMWLQKQYITISTVILFVLAILLARTPVDSPIFPIRKKKDRQCA